MLVGLKIDDGDVDVAAPGVAVLAQEAMFRRFARDGPVIGKMGSDARERFGSDDAGQRAGWRGSLEIERNG